VVLQQEIHNSPIYATVRAAGSPADSPRNYIARGFVVFLPQIGNSDRSGGIKPGAWP
jgi:hypothetical protein